MVATTMEFNDLVKRLSSDFPKLKFVQGDDFHWSASTSTVHFYDSSTQNTPLLLHEASHGILGHESYHRDIELLKLEREAWNKANELSILYGVKISEDTVEDALDSYRNWLHTRSICPACSKNGVQIAYNTYACVVCSSRWKVNEARTCGLRRTRVR